MSATRRAAILGLVSAAALAISSRLPARAAMPAAARVAYHLSDRDKVDFVVGNIANHIKGVGGPEHVEIALVVHGPALAAFKASGAGADFARRLAHLVEEGVSLGACGNTLDGEHLAIGDLLPGFSRIEEGGVVRLATLQAAGYAYLRP